MVEGKWSIAVIDEIKYLGDLLSDFRMRGKVAEIGVNTGVAFKIPIKGCTIKLLGGIYVDVISRMTSILF